MASVTLTQGKVALVDDADFDWINQWKWHAAVDSKGTWYAQRCEPCPRKTVRMHNSLMGSGLGDARTVDHINCDGLDNRRCNLRWATAIENRRNKSLSKNNKLGFKGVWRSRNRYRAKIYVNGRAIYLGGYSTPEEAHLSYCNAAVRYFGEFANFGEGSHVI